MRSNMDNLEIRQRLRFWKRSPLRSIRGGGLVLANDLLASMISSRSGADHEGGVRGRREARRSLLYCCGLIDLVRDPTLVSIGHISDSQKPHVAGFARFSYSSKQSELLTWRVADSVCLHHKPPCESRRTSKGSRFKIPSGIRSDVRLLACSDRGSKSTRKVALRGRHHHSSFGSCLSICVSAFQFAPGSRQNVQPAPFFEIQTLYDRFIRTYSSTTSSETQAALISSKKWLLKPSGL